MAVRLDDIIHKKEKNFTNIEQLMTYYKAGFHSPATPEAARLEVFKKIGIVEGPGNSIKQDILDINTACTEALTAMRTEHIVGLTLLSRYFLKHNNKHGYPFCS